uniref:peptide-methionine (R)-S-oxide reductase MsrB n=1 Tax=Aureliella helgolandensis TaxID=2527968 RepID=UPI003704A0B8
MKATESAEPRPWQSFRKPSPLELKQTLSAIQFKVSQEDGTEPAFRNEFWDNKEAGLYVDIISGEPLFSSSAKFKSGTGWPSFVTPISPDAVEYRLDRTLFSVRTEVRSKYGDSHLGHVFDDGPVERGGKRYCMNSAALRFIPKDKMESEGYADYLKFVE